MSDCDCTAEARRSWHRCVERTPKAPDELPLDIGPIIIPAPFGWSADTTAIAASPNARRVYVGRHAQNTGDAGIIVVEIDNEGQPRKQSPITLPIAGDEAIVHALHLEARFRKLYVGLYIYTGQQGTAVVLLNWSGKPRQSTRVRLASGRPVVEWRSAGDGIEVVVPLDTCDVLLLERFAAEPTR